MTLPIVLPVLLEPSRIRSKLMCKSLQLNAFFTVEARELAMVQFQIRFNKSVNGLA